jgi:hypothetical protein
MRIWWNKWESRKKETKIREIESLFLMCPFGGESDQEHGFGEEET